MIASSDGMIGLPEAAIALRITRERLLRRIQTGAVAGEKRGGRYFIARSEVERVRREQAAGATPVAVSSPT